MTWRKTAKGKQAYAFEELVKEKLVAPQQKVRTANVNKLRALHADVGAIRARLFLLRCNPATGMP